MVTNASLFPRLLNNNFSESGRKKVLIRECSSYTEVRTGCDLEANINQSIHIWFNGTVNNTVATNTFKKDTSNDVRLPALNWTVTKTQDKFHISWTPPEIERRWKFEIIYTECSETKHVELTTLTHFSANLLTEETGSGSWTYLVWTVSKNGDNLEDSTKVPKTIETPKPRAQVEDIQCFVNLNNETKAKEMNCSWVPGNQALYLSFRICGHTHKTILGLKNCVWPYSNAMRKGCYLKADGVANNICMLLESEAGQSTFKLLPMIDPPELSIGEEGDNLKLSWTLPPILKDHPWIFMVCSRKCSHAEVCQNYTTKGEPWFMPYDKSCRYELRSRVRTGPSVPPIFSQFGQVVFYGNNLPADKTLTVVAVVLPIILSVCIFLSCYCFRRHSSILCPVIPDPSAIFKEMMMDGNKDLKSTMGSLYTPVPEPVESCKVDTVTDSIVVPLNS